MASYEQQLEHQSQRVWRLLGALQASFTVRQSPYKERIDEPASLPAVLLTVSPPAYAFDAPTAAGTMPDRE